MILQFFFSLTEETKVNSRFLVTEYRQTNKRAAIKKRCGETGRRKGGNKFHLFMKLFEWKLDVWNSVTSCDHCDQNHCADLCSLYSEKWRAKIIYIVRLSVSSVIFTTSSGERCPLVAGSVGPYGAFLHNGSEYTGDYAEQMSVEVSLATFFSSYIGI